MSHEPIPSIGSGATSAPTASTVEVNQLAARITALENRLPAESWLFGSSFLKRVFAIWGHYFVAQLIIGIVLGILFLGCTLVFGGLLAGLSNR
jgi:hypothetical protein